MPDVLAAVSNTANAVAVGVTVVATLAVLALLTVLWALLRSARRLHDAAAELEREAHAVLADLGRTVADAGQEVDRVGDLIGSAESITTTVASASRLAYVTLANPVIKVLAFGSGAARASRRLRAGQPSGEVRGAPSSRRLRETQPSTSTRWGRNRASHVVARSRTAR